MKKVIKQHDLYGNILYKEEYWRKVEPLKCIYNNSIVKIPVDMSLIGSDYIEYQLGISNLILEYSTLDEVEEEKKEYDEYGKKVKERYIQYLVNIEDTIKKVRIDDYARYRKEWTEEEIVKHNSPTVAKKILNASSPEKILKLVKVKHIIVYDDRVVLELKCPWYTASDAGVLLNENGTIEIGNGEMMQ